MNFEIEKPDTLRCYLLLWKLAVVDRENVFARMQPLMKRTQSTLDDVAFDKLNDRPLEGVSPKPTKPHTIKFRALITRVPIAQPLRVVQPTLICCQPTAF